MLREAKQQAGNEIPQTLKEQIVLEHAPLIRYIVNRIAVRLPSHIDLDDLHNTGVIGLMDAIEKYDPEKNCKFKTYAEFRIKGAILDQLRSLDWVPRSVRQKSRRLERAYGEVEQRLGRSATEEEVADSLGLQIDKFHELLNQVRGISLVNLEEIRGNGAGRRPHRQLRRHRRGRPLREPLRRRSSSQEMKQRDRRDDRGAPREGAPRDLALLLRRPEHEGDRQRSSASPSRASARSTRRPCSDCARS